ncbi:MAG: Gfo/Idh/MocA family oxidoreductase [Bryobacterales bacterium]|nr:Gfo/Idh/MocA family oxidoreductase [Bryobacterales bacterium]
MATMERNLMTRRSATLASLIDLVTAGQRGFAAETLTRPLRVGFVGVGDRGSAHLDVLLNMDSVEVPALCDINDAYLYRAKRWVTETGKPEPALYGRSDTDWKRMLERDDLDVIVCATGWKWHAPVCEAAMRAGKHATTEVPAGLSEDECWALVDASEETGKHCMMLEQANYYEELLQILNMVRAGVFGEMLHCAGGYVHDLRLVKFDPEREPWRLQYSVQENRNLYPTHAIGPIAWILDINRGDQFDYMVSMSSKARCLNDFARMYYGPESPYASMVMKQGDVNVSMIRTKRDRTVTLHFDTNTPHPHTAEFRVQGTKGHYAENLQSVYIDGRSPKPHTWEPVSNYAAEYQHPIYKTLDHARLEKRRRGHGGDLMTALMWSRYLRAIRAGVAPDQDVYDAASWSVLGPISARSVDRGGEPVDIPDFTRGKWQTREPLRLG